MLLTSAGTQQVHAIDPEAAVSADIRGRLGRAIGQQFLEHYGAIGPAALDTDPERVGFVVPNDPATIRGVLTVLDAVPNLDNRVAFVDEILRTMGPGGHVIRFIMLPSGDREHIPQQYWDKARFLFVENIIADSDRELGSMALNRPDGIVQVLAAQARGEANLSGVAFDKAFDQQLDQALISAGITIEPMIQQIQDIQDQRLLKTVAVVLGSSRCLTPEEVFETINRIEQIAPLDYYTSQQRTEFKPQGAAQLLYEGCLFAAHSRFQYMPQLSTFDQVQGNLEAVQFLEDAALLTLRFNALYDRIRAPK